MKYIPHADIVIAAKAQLRLPAPLRTAHWYNDWQHAVFIITFDHLMAALRGGRSAIAERLIDKLTVYLFVHFLCEEEGMSWAVTAGYLDADALRGHQNIHLAVLNHWHDSVQKPFKTGALAGGPLATRIQAFYEKILHHIDTVDQGTYGAKSERAAAVQLAEVAHLAQSGLPLSPNMAGAGAVVAACHGGAYALLSRPTLPLRSGDALRPLSLATLAGDSAADSLRARFLRATGGADTLLLRAA